MCYDLVHETGTTTSEVYRARMKDLANRWTEKDHQMMLDFIESGGYHARIKARAETFKVKTPLGAEEFGIEFEEIKRQVTPKSQDMEHGNGNLNKQELAGHSRTGNQTLS